MVCCAHFFLDEALPRAPTKDMRLRPAGCQIWPRAIFDRLSRITRRGQRGPSKRRYFSSGPRKVYTAKPFDQGGGDQPKSGVLRTIFFCSYNTANTETHSSDPQTFASTKNPGTLPGVTHYLRRDLKTERTNAPIKKTMSARSKISPKPKLPIKRNMERN